MCCVINFIRLVRPLRAGAAMTIIAWMNGGGWFTNMFEITAHDHESGNISFENPEQPGFPKGGWQGGRNWQGVNGKDGAPWIVDGVYEE